MLAYLRLLYFLARPGTIFVRRPSHGLGDNLLLSAILPDLRSKYPGRKIVVETPWPELFKHNPDADWVTDRHLKTTRRHLRPRYHVDETTTVSVFEQLTGCVGEPHRAAPRMFLTTREIAAIEHRFPFDYIAICPVGKTSFCANRKEWGLSNFQRLRDLLADFQFVQIGLPADPLLERVIDARELSVREAGAAISRSLFFLGLEGGMMHLARSVEQRAAVIYGGYIRPEIIGYEENVNLYSAVPCSPCFHSDRRHEPCESMACMKGLSPEHVYDSIMSKLLSGRRQEA
jgi:ADP-heptose:LPS heptosyltransferase